MEKFHKRISILGSGWLGFPLAKHLVLQGNKVKISTTSKNRFQELQTINAETFIVDIDLISNNIQVFLDSDILIINIPSKNIDSFANLLNKIKISPIEKVIFISSTSVYEDSNTTIYESDGLELPSHPLVIIENIFKSSNKIETTVLRFGGLIGYNRHQGKFFGSNSFVPNPDSFVNLIHRDDCIEIINQIILQEVWNETFNCCADTHPTKREFYTKANLSFGLVAPKFIDSGTSSFKIISNAKVKKYLNYIFKHSDLMKIEFLTN